MIALLQVLSKVFDALHQFSIELVKSP